MGGPNKEPTFLRQPPVAPEKRGVTPPPPRPAGEILSLAVSGADRMLAAGRSTGVVEVWLPGLLEARPDMRAPFLRGEGHTREVRAVAFSPVDPNPPEGAYHLLASGSVDGTVRTWHLGDHARDLVHSHHASGVLCLAWSPDGRTLLSGSEDQTIGHLDEAGAGLRPAHDGSVLTLAYAPDGKTYASGGFDSALRVWDAASHELVKELAADGPVWSLAFTPDGGTVVFAYGDGLGAWKPAGRGRKTWADPEARFTARCYLAAVRPDGLRYATHFGADVALIDPAGGDPVLLRGHEAEVTSLAFLADGRLFSGDKHGVLCLWDTSGVRVLRAP